ncbi:MAG: sulfite exporter TauE/SafE family protein [Planctomycetales bacterium]|nr:sulfite exporter TauE/SafE family protein [Planctomycetales bacterium]
MNSFPPTRRAQSVNLRVLSLIVAILGSTSQVAALAQSTENWYQWRGPLGTGVAVDADPPVQWNETENVRWKTSIPGRGHSTPVVWYLILVVAGFVAGVVNTIAGGGSFLTLPALMLFGLDPKIANGTNRVAVLFSSGAAVATFHRHGHLDRQLANRLTFPTMLGVPAGALMAVCLPPQAFEPVFGAIFLAMAVVLVLNPKRIAEAATASKRSERLIMPLFFAIGIYVGFIQAGMGILILLAMSLIGGRDLVASNAVKNWIGFLVTLAATVMFAYYDLIQWLPGLVMAVGNLIGGFVGAKLAIKKGNRMIFWFLIVVMVATGLKLIAVNVYRWIG